MRSKNHLEADVHNDRPGERPAAGAPVRRSSARAGTSDGESARDANPEQRVTPQRTRTILAGLVTVAILAVLAIAIFDGGSDDDSDETPPTVVDQVATTGGEENQEAVDGPELGSLAVTGYPARLRRAPTKNAWKLGRWRSSTPRFDSPMAP